MATSPATSAAINKILREFHPFDRVGGKVGLLGPHTHPKESIPTFLVAAFDAREEVQNMADFVCDGVDDDDEIMGAVGELPFDGGRILLSEGEFHPDWNFIKIPHDVHLQGMGPKSTHLDMNDTNPTGGVGPVIATTGGGSLGSISDLMIELPAGGLSSQVGIAIALDFFVVDNVFISFPQGRAIELLGANDWVTIRNCVIEFAELAGIWDDGQGNDNLSVINNIIHITGSGYGVDMNQGCRFTMIRGNRFTGSGDGGIYVSQPDQLLIVDNSIEISSSVRAPIRVDNEGAGGTSGNVLIANNTMRGSGSDGGIHLADIDNALIEGNMIWDPSGSGIFCTDCFEIEVVRNHIWEPDEHGVAFINTRDSVIADNRVLRSGSFLGDGVFLDNSNRNYVHGNKITPEPGTTRYGINISTVTCDDNIVVGNSLGDKQDYANSPLQDLGERTHLVYPDHEVYGDNFVDEDVVIDVVGVTDDATPVKSGTVAISDDVDVIDDTADVLT